VTKFTRSVLTVLAVGFMVFWGGVYAALSWVYTSQPASDPQTLPETHFEVTSSEGKLRLYESGAKEDFDKIKQYYFPMGRPSYSGVASACIVLNAMRDRKPFLREDWFFTDEVSAISSEWSTTFFGVDLETLAEMMETHGRRVEVTRAAQTKEDKFRKRLKNTLKRKSSMIIVNYLRSAMGQDGGGHFSPVAAYHEELDLVLIADVAKHNNPWVWVPLPELWAAMDTMDSSSGRTRGYLMVVMN